MKKTILFAVVTLLCVTAFVMTSDSADAADTSGTCGDNLTWSLSDDGTLTISGTGKMKDFDDSHGSSVNFSPWDETTVKKIVIESGVTSIGNNAFSCIEKYASKDNGYFLSTALTSVTIPNSVTSIGEYAFAGCTKLTSVSGDLSGVTSLGTYAFANCPLGTSDKPCTLDLSKVTSIGSCAFYQCSGLGSVTLGNSLTTLGNSAFQGTALTTVTIPDTVTSIEASLFWNCTSLTEVKFNSNITSIGSYAFAGCTKLASVSDLSKVTNVGQCTFMGTALTSVTFGDSFVSFNTDGSNGSAFKNCKSLETVTLGKNVKAIGPEEFFGCTSLETIDLSNVTSIGYSAFEDCVALTSVELSKVTSLGYQAFSGCTSLTSVGDLTNVKTIGRAAFEKTTITSITIPDAVKSIEGSTFNGCASLTEVKFNSNLTSIGAQAFSGCTSLTSVGDLTNVTSIGWGAFQGTALASVELGTGIKVITDIVFKDCTKLTSVTGLANVTSIGVTAFNGCTSLTSISFGDNLATLGQGAFKGCTALTSVTGLANVTSIGDAAFNGCTSLTSISFGDNLTTLGEGIFFGCISLGSVALGTGVTTIPKETFSNCSKLTSVTGLSKVTSVGNSAFKGCTALPSVTFGTLTAIGNNAFDGCILLESVGDLSKVTTIGTSAFCDCKALTSVTGLSKVTSVGNSAFEKCESLTSVTFGNNLPSIGEYTFRDCTALTSVTVGDGSSSSVEGFTIGIYAFNGCTYLKSVAFNIPCALTRVGSYAFNACTSLKEVTVNFTAFDSTVFSGNNAITKVTFGSNCASVGAGAFKNCTALSTVIFKSGDKVVIGESAFEGCFQTECPDHSDSGKECVYGDSGSAVIGNSAFKGCIGLHSMYFDSGVASVGDSAFEGCTAFVGFDMGNTETIGAKAFKGCTSLDGICINYAKSIGVSAFEGCTALTSFSNPDSPEGSEWTLMVTTIGANAFKGCSKLTSLIFWLDDTGPLTIGESAFSGCTGLTSITFEYYDKTKAANESVTVGANAFSGCTSLASMTFSSDIKSMAFAVDGTSFPDSVTLRSVTFPTGTCTGSLFTSSVTYIFADGSRTVVQRDSDGKLMAEEPAPTSGGSKCSYHWVKDGIAVPVTGNVDYSETDEHELNHVEATDPACSKKGNKEYWYCSVCGKKFSDSAGTTGIADVDIAATGHEYKEVAAKAATSDTPGNIRYWKCEKCTEVFKYDDKSLTSVQAVTTYLVRFMNDSEQVSSNELLSGETIVVPANQTKNADAQYTYTWSGWSVDQKKTVTPSAKATKCVTYYALYDKTVNLYAVIFKNDDTVLQTDPVEYGVSPKYTGDEPTKKKTNEYTYEFLGWSLKSDGTGNTYGATSTLPTVKESVTYYAVFKEIANEYTVNYLVDDKAVEGYSDETHAYNSEVTVLGAYLKTGYTVTEWKAEGITVSDGKFTMPARDVTFTATSTINSYILTVKYVYENGTDVAAAHTESVTYNSSYSVTSPAVTGYTADKLTVSGTMPAENVEVTVTYKANTYSYTVKYQDTDGNEIALSETGTAKYDSDVDAPVKDITGYNTPDKATIHIKVEGNEKIYTYTPKSYGYTVKYVDTDGNEIAEADKTGTALFKTKVTVSLKAIPGYNAKSDPVNIVISSDADKNILKCEYEIITYTITFDDGTNQTAVKYTVKDKSVSEPAVTEKTGHSGVWEKYTLDLTDKTVKAVYTLNKYTISFDIDGGSPAVADITEDYGTSVTAPAAPTKTGYNFQYWAKNGVKYEFTTIPAENIKLTAVWDAIEYTVTFMNGDEKVYENKFDYGTVPSCTVTPTKAADDTNHYKFKGWSADGTTVLDTLPTVSGETTYKAVFEGIAHTPTAAESKNATCTEPGITNGTICSGCGKVLSTETSTPALGHNKTHHDAVPATCTENGTLEYWSCDRCSKNFSNEACTNVLADVTDYASGHDKVPVKTSYMGATCTEPGNKEYYTCSKCSKNFSDEACENVLEIVKINALGHDIVLKSKESATSDKAGCVEHYACSRCAKCFTDQDGKTEVSAESVKTYLVTFMNGGISADAVEVRSGESPVYSKADPVKDQTDECTYEFLGWSVDGKTVITLADVKVSANITYTALFESVPREYTVTYVVDSAEVKKETKTYNTTVSTYSYSKEGYTVSSWATNDTSVTVSADGKFIMPAHNVVFESTSQINTYYVTYKVDGTQVGDVKGYEYGTEVTVSDAYVKAGYTAEPWATSDVAVSEGKFKMPAHNVVFSTTTSISICIITFDTKGGSEVSAITQNYGTSVSAPATVPTKAGYTFKFWSADEINEYNFTTISSSITLYAVWTANEYQYIVRYVDGADKDLMSQFFEKAAFGSTVTPVIKSITGYTAPTETQTIMISDDVSKNVVKYIYTVKNFDYTVSYVDTAGKVLKDKFTGSAAYGTTVTPVTEDIVGYSAPTETQTITISDDVSKNVVKYIYTAKKYIVIFMSEGTEFYKNTFEYDTVPSCNGTPSKTADADNHYAFKGWTVNGTDVVEISKVTGEATYTAVFDGVAHTPTAAETKGATCTEPGITNGTVCSVCNKVLSSETSTPALGHDYSVKYKWNDDHTVCTATKTCSRCSDVVNVYGTVTSETTDATCTQDGATVYTAKFNDADLSEQTFTKTIGAKGHTEVTLEAKEPTCTETGLTAGTKCSVCNEILVAQQTVDAKGHTEVTLPASETAEYRLTEGKKCSVCNEILVPQTKITVTVKQNDDGTETEVQTSTTEVGSDKVETVVEKAEGSTGASEISTVIKTSGSEVSDKTVEKALEQMGAETSEKKTVTIDNTSPTGSEEKKTVATISAESLSKIKAAGVETEIKGDLATLKISQNAVETLVASGEMVSLSATYADSLSELTSEQKEKIGNAPLFKLDAFAGAAVVSKFGGNIAVTLPYALPEGKTAGDVAVYYLGEDGKFAPADSCSYADGYVTFETDHFSYWTITDSKIVYDEASGSSDNGSGSNTMIIAIAVIAVIAVIGCAFVFLRMRAKTN